MPTPKKGYANEYIIAGKLRKEKENYKNIIKNQDFMKLATDVSKVEVDNINKKLDLGGAIKLYGMANAVKEVQNSRNIFQKFFAWITGKSGKENELTKKVDEILKNHSEYGMSSKDFKKYDENTMGRAYAKMCDQELFTKEDELSNEIFADIKNDGIHMVTDEEVTKAKSDYKIREEEYQKRQEQFQKDLDATFGNSDLIAYGNKAIEDNQKQIDSPEMEI